MTPLRVIVTDQPRDRWYWLAIACAPCDVHIGRAVPRTVRVEDAVARLLPLVRERGCYHPTPRRRGAGLPSPAVLAGPAALSLPLLGDGSLGPVGAASTHPDTQRS